METVNTVSQFEKEHAAVSDQLDLNDIRLAIGTLVNGQRDLAERLEKAVERLDDIGALLTRTAALSALLEDVESFGAQIPGLLRRVADDPMIGMFVSGPVNSVADEFEAHLAQRAKARASAPEIER